MRKYIIVFFIFLCVGCSSWYVIHSKLSHQSSTNIQKEQTIPIQTIREVPFTYTQNFIGSVQAIQSVDVVPYLSAFLKEVRVQAGEEVHEGDTLFLLDERIPYAELKQAKEASSQAYATRANAETYYLRMKNTESKAISPTELEQAKTEFEAADATYQKTLAAQNQAQTIYDYTIIQAPISGWVGNITATVGEYLSPERKTLATIISFSPIRLMFSVPMSAYEGDDFSSGEVTLQIVLADGRILKFNKFKVVRDNQADKTTDSLSFFVDVPNDKKFLIPGAYVDIQFLHPKTGILANKNWITLTPDGAEAFVLANGIIEKRTIEIGAPISNQYWIKKGLKEGEQIITVPVSPYQIGQSAEGVSK